MPRRSETALSLMKMALALLDRDSEILAACHLQHAIEIAEEHAAVDLAEHTPLTGRQVKYSPH